MKKDFIPVIIMMRQMFWKWKSSLDWTYKLENKCHIKYQLTTLTVKTIDVMNLIDLEFA